MLPAQPSIVKEAQGLTSLPKVLTDKNGKATVAKLVHSEAKKDRALQVCEDNHNKLRLTYSKKVK